MPGNREYNGTCINCRLRAQTCVIPESRYPRSRKDHGDGSTQERLARIEACLQQVNAQNAPTSASPHQVFAVSLTSPAKATHDQAVGDAERCRQKLATKGLTIGEMTTPSRHSVCTTTTSRSEQHAPLVESDRQARDVSPSRSIFNDEYTPSRLPDADNITNETSMPAESPDELRERSSILSSEIVSTFHHYAELC
jgi:hypothetical protein